VFILLQLGYRALIAKSINKAEIVAYEELGLKRSENWK